MTFMNSYIKITLNAQINMQDPLFLFFFFCYMIAMTLENL